MIYIYKEIFFVFYNLKIVLIKIKFNKINNYIVLLGKIIYFEILKLWFFDILKVEKKLLRICL